MFDLFEASYELGPNGESLSSITLLDMKAKDAQFKTTIKSIDSSTLFFALKLRVLSDTNLASLGLDFSDFASHDPIFDFIFLLQSEKRARDSYKSEMVKARAATESKSNFLATMSHEVRTPLNGIMGMIQAFDGEGLTQKQSGALFLMKKSAQSMLRIVNDILDLSKIESGKIEVREEKFSLLQVLEDALAPFSLSAEKRGTQIELNYDSKIHDQVVSDPQLINQVLTNLVGNSVKFTNSGLVSLNTELISSTDGHEVVRFFVEDSGCGMETDDLARVMKPFEQAKYQDKKSLRKGTGLGLSICEAYVRSLGGELKIESLLGVGTKVSFDLRFRIDKDNRSSNMSQLNVDEFESLKGLRVLVAEDDGINQVVIMSLLESLNPKVKVVENGEGVIRALSSGESFDVVLMDCQMPVMDGFETTKAVRNLGYTELPIIGATARLFDDDIRSCLSCGMNDVLPKPIDQNELFLKISNQIELSK
ncbi:MAG: response regulator [Bdellovibrionales bacterium]|nr:response regulator [Bdellovibrionales bacterium]